MAWTTVGSLKGPKGDSGSQGLKGDKGDKGDVGEAGIQGIQGIKGDQGIPGVAGSDGADGKGIEIAGSSATYASLPNGLGVSDAGKGYLVQTDGKLYIWDGVAFPAQGSGVAFQGPKGDQGIQGELGNQGVQGVQGVKGDKGDKGDVGSTGTAGSDGARGSKWFTGAGVPSGVSGSIVGDMYMDTQTGDVYQLS